MRDWMIDARGRKTQTEIASKAAISQQMYSAIEREEATPSVSVAKRLSKILDIDWRRFYEDSSTSSTSPSPLG